ncbi:MAG: T9SS type A sorting domain-containing protein [Dysgonamonadaceae bacterium]|nr:T9SS type A sorting domain-containing protein [Dysgonamonadaceae bacterium]
MKKISFILCALAVATLSIMAQGYESPADIVVFDFDNVNPVLDYSDAVHINYTSIGPDTIYKVANPNPDAVNSSAWVGEYHHNSPRQYEGVYFINQPDSRIYNTLSLKYLIPPGVLGRVQYKFITNDNIPDTTFNVVLYPIAPNIVRFFEPVEGDGSWHELIIEIPAANKIKAIAIGFNSDWSPGGKNPDNEAEVNPNMSGTLCYFDDVILKATQSEFHTLYYEDFDTPTPYWGSNTTNAGCPSLAGGIQPVSSIDNLIFTQLWVGDWYNSQASFLKFPKESHIDFLNIPTGGYNDYEINIGYGTINSVNGDAAYGLINKMDVLYRESGTETWDTLDVAQVVAYDKILSYHTAIRYEEMRSMDLRLSLDSALCGMVLTNLQITGAWTGTSSVKNVKANIDAYYNSVQQTLNAGSEAKIEIYGIDGVLRKTAQNVAVLNVAALPKGVYVARITASKAYTTLKFIK